MTTTTDAPDNTPQRSVSELREALNKDIQWVMKGGGTLRDGSINPNNYHAIMRQIDRLLETNRKSPEDLDKLRKDLEQLIDMNPYVSTAYHMAKMSEMSEYDTLISMVKYLAAAIDNLEKYFEDYAARDVRPMLIPQNHIPCKEQP